MHDASFSIHTLDNGEQLITTSIGTVMSMSVHVEGADVVDTQRIDLDLPGAEDLAAKAMTNTINVDTISGDITLTPKDVPDTNE